MSIRCPSCNVRNFSQNTHCDICNGELRPAKREGDRAKWVWISMVVSLAMSFVLLLLQLHPVTMVLAMFYGPLISSYYGGSMGRSALGAVIALLAIVFVAVIASWSTLQPMLAVLGGFGPMAFRVIIGAAVACMCVIPITMTGGLVGERLSERRGSPESV